MHLDEEPQDQEDINRLLRHLDHPAPPLTAEAVIAQARRRRAGWGRWAAGILLVTGLAGVAYALPGSPVRRWVESVIDGIADTRNPPGLPDSLAGTPNMETPAAGIAVDPGTRLRILFTRTTDSATARVMLTGGSEVTVRAPGGAATFTWDPNELVINNSPGAATYDIAIPKSAPLVEILVGARRVFLKEGGTVIASTAETAGENYLIPIR